MAARFRHDSNAGPSYLLAASSQGPEIGGERNTPATRCELAMVLEMAKREANSTERAVANAHKTTSLVLGLELRSFLASAAATVRVCEITAIIRLL